MVQTGPLATYSIAMPAAANGQAHSGSLQRQIERWFDF